MMFAYRTFSEDCPTVFNKLIEQIKVWNMSAPCNNSEKCLYQVGLSCGRLACYNLFHVVYKQGIKKKCMTFQSCFRNYMYAEFGGFLIDGDSTLAQISNHY